MKRFALLTVIYLCSRRKSNASFAVIMSPLILLSLRTFINKSSQVFNFDVVFNHAIRINETQYIRRDKIHFDVDRIDDALEKFFNGVELF